MTSAAAAGTSPGCPSPDRVGRERIIFGADLPYYDYRLLQQIIEQAPIDDDLKDRIASRNILRADLDVIVEA